MPDICKCQGGDCPIKESCYRFTSKADMLQSYFAVIPFDKEKNECDHYWPVKNRKD